VWAKGLLHAGGDLNIGVTWQPLAAAAAAISTLGIVLFSGIWPGAPNRKLSKIDYSAAPARRSNVRTTTPESPSSPVNSSALVRSLHTVCYSKHNCHRIPDARTASARQCGAKPTVNNT